MIDRLRVRSLEVPFREAFRHASASRTATAGVWVEAEGGGHTGFGEGCPRPYVTGETLDTARAFLAAHEASVRATVSDLDSLRRWMTEHGGAIDANPAAWCALELALLDLLGKQAELTVESLLGLPSLPQRFQYTAVLGDADPDAFRAAGERYRTHGFRDYKVKLSGDAARDGAKCEWLRGLGADVTVRADANNLWADADSAIRVLRRLEYPFVALEEPVRAGRYDEMRTLASALACRIVLDESLTRREQLDELASTPGVWIANVRVSKMGGLLRSLAIAGSARRAGIPITVGAHVGETSLLTRAALAVAAAAGEALHAQEGAFGTLLLSTDVCDPPLMFGRGGVLETARHPMLQEPGFGISSVDLPPGCLTEMTHR